MQNGKKSTSEELTRREKEVWYWVVRGKTNQEIARILIASAQTIRKHFEHIRAKLLGESRLALIAAYWQAEVDWRDELIAKLLDLLG